MDININISKTHVFADTFFRKKKAVKNPSAGTLVFHFSSSGLLVLLTEGGSDIPRAKNFLRLDTDASKPDPERAKALSDYLASLGLRSAPRVIVVSSEGVVFRQLTMPAMPDSDLKPAVAWELKKKYFLNPDEQLVGILGVYDSDSEEGPLKLVNVFHTEKKAALDRLSIVSALGYQIQAFWPGPAALSRLAASQAGKEESDLLIVDMAGPSIRITAVQKGVTMLSRVIQSGVPGPHLPDTVFPKVAEEIGRSIEFYEMQKFARPVAHIFVVGTGFNAETLCAFLSSKFSQRVTPIDGARYLSEGLSDEQRAALTSQPGQFAEAFGALAVREETLNLLPDEIHAHNRRRQIDQSMRKVLLVTATVLGFWVAWVGVQAQILSAQLGFADKEWQEIQTGKSAFTDIMNREKQRQAAAKGAIDMPALLKELSRLTPSPIVLDAMTFSRDNGAFQLSGFVQDLGGEHVKIVTQYVTNLNASPFFKSVTLGQTMEDAGEGRVRFQVDAVPKGLS